MTKSDAGASRPNKGRSIHPLSPRHLPPTLQPSAKAMDSAWSVWRVSRRLLALFEAVCDLRPSGLLPHVSVSHRPLQFTSKREEKNRQPFYLSSMCNQFNRHIHPSRTRCTLRFRRRVHRLPGNSLGSPGTPPLCSTRAPMQPPSRWGTPLLRWTTVWYD